MSGNLTKFEPGTFVWGKMQGYPPWPGKVQDPADFPLIPNKGKGIKKDAQLIMFYGSKSNNLAWIPLGNIYPYLENKIKFGKNGKVKKAYQEIQREAAESGEGGEELDHTPNSLSVSHESSSYEPSSEADISVVEENSVKVKAKATSEKRGEKRKSGGPNACITPSKKTKKVAERNTAVSKSRKILVAKSPTDKRDVSKKPMRKSKPTPAKRSKETLAVPLLCKRSKLQRSKPFCTVTEDIPETSRLQTLPDSTSRFSEDGFEESVEVVAQQLNTGMTSPRSTAGNYHPGNTHPTTIPNEPRVQIPTNKKIGFLGLGKTGVSLALNLIKSGHDVTVWDLRSAHYSRFERIGAKIGKSPADVVDQCAITFSYQENDEDASEIAYGGMLVTVEEAAVRRVMNGKAFVEMTTLMNGKTGEMLEQIKDQKGRFLEAPFHGGNVAASEGKLHFYASGDIEVYTEIHSCVQALGERFFFIDNLPGSGTNYKLLLSMYSSVAVAALSETMALAEHLGLDQFTLLEIYRGSDVGSRHMTKKGKSIVEGSTEPDSTVAQHSADMKKVMELSEQYDQPLHVAGATYEVLKRTKGMGLGDKDISTVYRQTHT